MPRPGTLPRPEFEAIASTIWIDEAIWGYKLSDQYTPAIELLSVLLVASAHGKEERMLREPEGLNRLTYRAGDALGLRHVLFNNQFFHLARAAGHDDASMWAAWTKRMTDAAGIDYRFAQLAEVVPSFDTLCSLVDLLRGTTFEGEGNNRWTSKFLFPFGPACLFIDLQSYADGAIGIDRRFFGRIGELAYFMLCRSGLGVELSSLLASKLLEESTPWNRLVSALDRGTRAHESVGVHDVEADTYLPYEHLPEFTRFAEDWLALLRLDLPGYDVVPHLSNLLGLHFLVYYLNRGLVWSRTRSPLTLVLEIIAPKRNTVRELATETYLRNDLLSRAAIENWIDEVLCSSPEWRAACAEPDNWTQLRKVAYEKTAWEVLKGRGGDYEGGRSPDALVKELSEVAMKRHEVDVARMHGRYARAIGLASKRGTRSIRYAPTDGLLRSLVFSNVPDRLEFQAFLARLFDRYGFVIGHRQAADFIGVGASDQKTFEENARRLERRLQSLGLLTRLSDACAYVVNPFEASA